MIAVIPSVVIPQFFVDGD